LPRACCWCRPTGAAPCGSTRVVPVSPARYCGATSPSPRCWTGCGAAPGPRSWWAASRSGSCQGRASAPPRTPMAARGPRRGGMALTRRGVTEAAGALAGRRLGRRRAAPFWVTLPTQGSRALRRAWVKEACRCSFPPRSSTRTGASGMTTLAVARPPGTTPLIFAFITARTAGRWAAGQGHRHRLRRSYPGRDRRHRRSSWPPAMAAEPLPMHRGGMFQAPRMVLTACGALRPIRAR
jgi:hypothetical protein